MKKYYHQLNNSDLQLSKILSIYESQTGAPYIEMSEIRSGQLIRSQPLTKKEAKRLAIELQANSNQVSSEIPRNLLYIHVDFADAPKMIWYTKPEMKMQLFSKETTISSGIYPVPGLIWFYKEKSLSLYALGPNNEEINGESELYKAPFLNVSDNVCLGTATRYRKRFVNFQSFMHHYEDLFWKSVFTHISDDLCFKQNLISWYKSNPTEIQYESLVSLKLKVKDLWKHSE